MRKSPNICNYTCCIPEGKKIRLIYAHLLPQTGYNKNLPDPSCIACMWSELEIADKHRDLALTKQGFNANSFSSVSSNSFYGSK